MRELARDVYGATFPVRNGHAHVSLEPGLGIGAPSASLLAGGMLGDDEAHALPEPGSDRGADAQPAGASA
jgi:hypothetical protein